MCAPADDGDGGAELREADGDSASEAGAAAGDECHVAREAAGGQHVLEALRVARVHAGVDLVGVRVAHRRAHETRRGADARAQLADGKHGRCLKGQKEIMLRDNKNGRIMELMVKLHFLLPAEQISLK